MSAALQEVAGQLNRSCTCVGTDVRAVQKRLDARLAQRSQCHSIAESHPHLFSELPIFIARQTVERIRETIAAIEATVANTRFAAAALNSAPQIANVDKGARGVLMGYDFHLSHEGPKLIEINTNAGGALLNLEMLKQQRVCCPEVEPFVKGMGAPEILEEKMFDMFASEWRRVRGQAALRTVAIVDSDPAGQYLYPEFVLFKELFERHDIQAFVVAPEDLIYRENELSFGSTRIDLVYNRLTDFYLETPASFALAQAYCNDAVVVTPHPRAHALFANKRNLQMLTDEPRLIEFGVEQRYIDRLDAAIPETKGVDAVDEEMWWRTRAQWFFKPVHGFGSRGSYRGDKLTRKAFGEILRSDYVAQRIVPPAERWLDVDTPLKYDVRAYTYAGEILLLAARLYQGQTTNFRTTGGGFAPLYIL